MHEFIFDCKSFIFCVKEIRIKMVLESIENGNFRANDANCLIVKAHHWFHPKLMSIAMAQALTLKQYSKAFR